jgi:hypothetical protein
MSPESDVNELWTIFPRIVQQSVKNDNRLFLSGCYWLECREKHEMPGPHNYGKQISSVFRQGRGLCAHSVSRHFTVTWGLVSLVVHGLWHYYIRPGRNGTLVFCFCCQYNYRFSFTPNTEIESPNFLCEKSEILDRQPLCVKEIPRLIWKPKVHYRVHNSPLLAPTLSQMNPVHILTPNFFKSILILLFMYSYHYWSLLQRFSDKLCMHFSAFPSMLPVPPISSSSIWLS